MGPTAALGPPTAERLIGRVSRGNVGRGHGGEDPGRAEAGARRTRELEAGRRREVVVRRNLEERREGVDLDRRGGERRRLGPAESPAGGRDVERQAVRRVADRRERPPKVQVVPVVVRVRDPVEAGVTPPSGDSASNARPS